MDRKSIVKNIAALASQDRDLFMGVWDALAQYIDNQGIDCIDDDDLDPDVIAKVDAADTAMQAFDVVIADLAR